MEFGNTANLHYMIIPVLIIIFLILGMLKREKILKNIGWDRDWKLMFLKTLFITIGTILVFIAFLSPQKLKEEQQIKIEGSELYVLMDVSKSMLTEDTYPNRLETSKKELKNILQNLKGDRVGIIPFSDSAYVQMPLTDDYNLALNYIDAIDNRLISGGGTELLEGLKLANTSFEKSGIKDKNVIIFSDGGEDEDEIISYVKKNKIKTFIFGVGTPNGGVIPIDNGFVKDDNGNIVVSKLNDSFMKKLASESGGEYYHIDNLNTSEAKNLVNDLGKLKKKSEREEKIKIYDLYYQYPLAIGMFFIVLGYLIRKNKKRLH